jgi:hypothetical protein
MDVNVRVENGVEPLEINVIFIQTSAGPGGLKATPRHQIVKLGQLITSGKVDLPIWRYE